MPASDYYDQLLTHLRAVRRNMVEGLMSADPPNEAQMQALANVQQAIAASEAVLAEKESASGGMPLKRS